MPFTALGGSAGTVTVGDVSLGLFPQALHPNVMAYVAAQTANGYSPSRERVDALNNLVWGLVGEGLWDKFQVIYPFLGGTTLNAHKWNLKDVRDANDAFRLTATVGAGFTYSDSGVQSNSTVVSSTQRLETYYVPYSKSTGTTPVGAIDSAHLSAYINIAPTINGSAIVGSLQGTTQAFQIGRLSTGANPIYGNPNLANTQYMSAATNATGFYNPVRTTSTSSVFYRNGASVATSAQATSSPTSQVYLFNRGIAANAASNGRLAFVSFGDGLTAQEARDFYTLVQAYQTALGRQV